MKPYPKCKDSGVEWIGVVPEGLYNDAQREECVWLFAIDEIKKNPRGKRGFEMVYGRPKTPLLRTDGERGFVFYDSGKSEKKYAVKGGNMYDWQRTSRKSRYQVVGTLGRYEN